MGSEHVETAAPAASEADPQAEAARPVLPMFATARATPLRLSARDALRLQRTLGNRAVAGLALARAPKKAYGNPDAFKDKRAMAEGNESAFFEPDTVFEGPNGDQFVYDPFDRTLTTFTPEDGPLKGQAIRLTFPEGNTDAPIGEVLSPLRAKALKWLRGKAGTFQEDETGRAARVKKSRDEGAAKRREWAAASPANAAALEQWQADTAAHAQGVQDWRDKKRKLLPGAVKVPPGMPQDARVTSCNLHTGQFGAAVLGVSTGGMDPRADAIAANKGGAFRTLESHPQGPKPGDIMSYGPVLKAAKQGGLRRTNFIETKHVGVLKSRRPSAPGKEIWTVVDGGQGTFEGRQEVRERSRAFTRERMEVQIPKRTSSGKFAGYEAETVEMVVGVMTSQYADAGQEAGDRLLRGWIDIDDYFGGSSEPLPAAAGRRVIPGKREAETVST